jgi:hypothetical protein
MYRLLLNSKQILLYLLLFACSTVKGGVVYAPGTMYLPDNAISLGSITLKN